MPNQKFSAATLLTFGLCGAPLFLGSLGLFGALDSSHSHLAEAVSRLGALGQPWGLWFGFFGLFLPGLCAVAVALELRRRLHAQAFPTRWATGLMIYGVMMALTVVPADFARMFQSPWTLVHTFFVSAAPLVFLIAVPNCATALRRLGASSVAVTTCKILGLLPIAEFLLYGVPEVGAGAVQRLMILTTHVAIAWISWTLLRLPPQDSARS